MINLLPPKERENLIQEENWKLVLILGILFLSLLMCLILILLSIQIYNSGKIQSQKVIIEIGEKEFEDPETQNFRKKIILINQNFSKLNSFYQSQTNLIEILEKISGTFPEEIYLTSLSYQKENLQISLSGYAPNREVLVGFKKNLEKEFPDAHFSPQSWFEPTDFQVNFKIVQ
ncbi:PilN domain-containing protein [Patescibacteria group bacterium]|nr:PilN domain-containing protein [Patescibacteria group bacterium]